MNGITDSDSEYSRRVREFVRSGFQPHFGRRQPHGPGLSLWERLNALRTELWLDTATRSASKPSGRKRSRP